MAFPNMGPAVPGCVSARRNCPEAIVLGEVRGPSCKCALSLSEKGIPLFAKVDSARPDNDSTERFHQQGGE